MPIKRRLSYRFAGPIATVHVYRDTAWDEYVCHIEKSRSRDADYHTTELSDAIGTAKAMCGNPNAKNTARTEP